MIDEEKLHSYARERVTALKAVGVVFDKKQLRFNDIVDVGLFYAACGDNVSTDIVYAGICDAVDACIPENPMHIPKGSVQTMIQDWMML